MTCRDVVTVFATIVGIAVAVFGVWTLHRSGPGWLTGLGWADVIINWFTIPTLAAHLVTLIAAPFVALNLQLVLEVTRAIGSVVLAVTLVAVWWRHRHDARDAVAGMAWAMLAVLLLEPSTPPWYYTWVLVIAVAFDLPMWVRATVVGASTFLLIVFQPDDAIVFYKPVEVALAAALAGLAAWSLSHRDPLRLGCGSGGGRGVRPRPARALLRRMPSRSPGSRSRRAPTPNPGNSGPGRRSESSPGLRPADDLAGEIRVQRSCRVETEIFLLGEQPLHHFVARVTAVDQDRHESVEMLGDAVLVHEQCRNRRGHRG